MTDVEIDLPLQPDEIRDRFSRRAATAIALITLLAAGVGFLHASATRMGGDADVEAQRLGVEAFATLVESEAQAQLELGAYGAVTQDVALRWSLHQQSLAASDPDRAALAEQAELWESLAKTAASRTVITDSSPFSPYQDLTFPQRFLTERSKEGFRLSALQDGVVEYATAWGGRAASYAAILALLAVSVYLLGLALTVPRPLARRSFAVTGGMLATAGVVWALVNLAAPPTRAPDEAAEHFAAGRVAIETASRPAEYEAAAREFSDSIALRPTFAQAYLYRASARFSAGSAQASGYLSATSVEAAEGARDDLERAVELGLDTPEVLGNLAFYTYLAGLLTDDDAALNRSVDLTRRTIDLRAAEDYDDWHELLLGNLAVALLAAGRDAEAATAYDRFVEHLAHTDAAGEVARDSGVAIELATGAMTDMEVLRPHRPEAGATIDALKGRIAAAVAHAPGPSSAGATVTEQAGEVVFAGELQFSVEYDALADTDYLSVYWFQEAADGSGWHALPEVSGPLWYLDGEDGEDTLERGEAGEYTYLAPLIENTWPPRCVDGGEYRAELYLNDRLVDVVDGTAEWAGLQPFIFRDLGMALCGPADWTRRSDRRLGYSDGFMSPDASRGALVERIHASGETLSDALDMALDRDGVPGGLEQVSQTDEYFLGLDRTLWREYTYPGGRLQVVAGFVPQEDVFLTLVVFATDADWDEGPGCADDRTTGSACLPLNLVESARAFDLAPSGKDVAPEDPGTGVLGLSGITFSTDLADDGEPVEPVEVAPVGISTLCGSWDFDGMKDGMVWSARWYANGVEAVSDSIVDAAWDDGPAGRRGLCLIDAEPLPEGEYELVVTVTPEEGADDERTDDSLFLGGDHPIVDFRIENQAAVEACTAYLSLPSAQHWGPDDLGEDITIGSGAGGTVSVPAGTYDLLVEDCDGNTLAEEFDVVVAADSPPFVVPA